MTGNQLNEVITEIREKKAQRRMVWIDWNKIRRLYSLPVFERPSGICNY
jgi:thymidylate synthase